MQLSDLGGPIDVIELTDSPADPARPPLKRCRTKQPQPKCASDQAVGFKMVIMYQLCTDVFDWHAACIPCEQASLRNTI